MDELLHSYLRTMVQLMAKEAALTRKMVHLMLLNTQMTAALEATRDAQPALSVESNHSQCSMHGQ